MLQLCWARALAIRGDAADAQAMTAAVLPASRSLEPGFVADALLVAIEAANPNEPVAALALASELVEVLDASGGDADTDLVDSLCRFARVLVPAGRPDLVERIAASMSPGTLFLDINIRSARAVLTEAEGDLSSASGQHLEAAAAWEAYGYPIEQAQSLLSAARCLRARGRPAVGELADARDIVARIGAKSLAADVEAETGPW